MSRTKRTTPKRGRAIRKQLNVFTQMIPQKKSKKNRKKIRKIFEKFSVLAGGRCPPGPPNFGWGGRSPPDPPLPSPRTPRVFFFRLWRHGRRPDVRPNARPDISRLKRKPEKCIEKYFEPSLLKPLSIDFFCWGELWENVNFFWKMFEIPQDVSRPLLIFAWH